MSLSSKVRKILDSNPNISDYQLRFELERLMYPRINLLAFDPFNHLKMMMKEIDKQFYSNKSNSSNRMYSKQIQAISKYDSNGNRKTVTHIEKNNNGIRHKKTIIDDKNGVNIYETFPDGKTKNKKFLKN